MISTVDIITSWRQVYCWWYGTTFSSPLISILILRRIAPDTADLSVLFSGENKHASISKVQLYIWLLDFSSWHLNNNIIPYPDCTTHPSPHLVSVLQWLSVQGSHQALWLVLILLWLWYHHPHPCQDKIQRQ